MEDLGLDWDDDYLKVSYQPWSRDLESVLAPLKPASVLYCAPRAGQRLAEAGRLVPGRESDSGAGIPSGLYLLTPRHADHPTTGIAVIEGGPEAAPVARRNRELEDDEPLRQAVQLHQRWHGRKPPTEPGSAPEPRPRFTVGDLVWVCRTNASAVVVRARSLAGGGAQYELNDGRKVFKVFEEDLEPLPEAADGPDAWLLREPEAGIGIAVQLTLAKLSTPLTNLVYSFQSSRTVFRPYQFRPVLRLLNGDKHRLLIADEVGLGKTIEAGLIWNELEQRRHLGRGTDQRRLGSFRALVVCPAMLVQKWCSEMEARFDRRLEFLDSHRLTELAESVRRGEDHEPFAGIISLERLRRAEQLELLTEAAPRFDLVIVDEAHYVRNPASRSHAAVSALSDWADALVLLSATPLNLGNADLFTLVSLLDPQAFPNQRVFELQLEPNRPLNIVGQWLADGAVAGPGTARRLLAELDRAEDTWFGASLARRPTYLELRSILAADRRLTPEEISAAGRCLTDLHSLSRVVTRTRKVDTTGHKALRVPEDIEVQWTERESAFYQNLHAWCLERARRSGTAAGFAAQMWLRQAASCIPAMQQRLRERFPDHAPRPGVGPERAGADLTDALAALDSADGVQEFDAETAAARAEDWAEDLSRLPGLLANVGPDSKFERFVELLRSFRGLGLRQVMVFSYFTRTLEYLAGRLGSEFAIRVMHGKVPPEERIAIMADFRAGDFDLLLVSEVGSEGLDFEFCNVLVNYDLPWNPMRVEQRIGRLDRFGQQHEKIFIFNMQVSGTIEADIFRRLYRRIGVFRDSIGPLEPILRGQLQALHQIVLDPHLTPEQRQNRVARLEVAQVDHGKDIAELAKSRELLVGLDDLLIQGFDEASPGQGRYLGPTEIRGLLEHFFSRCGHGRLRPATGSSVTADDLIEVVGDQTLAELVNEAAAKGILPVRPGSELLGPLHGSTPFRACFTAQTATSTGTALLSVRHPLVRTAQWYLEQHCEDLPRFGHVLLPNLPPGSRHLVEVRLAESQGVVPRRELWTTAADLATGADAPAVGQALLTALAGGGLLPGSRSVTPAAQTELRRRWETVSDAAAMEDQERRRSLADENDRLAAARRETVDATFQVKIEQAERLAERVQDERIRQLHRSRALHLRAEQKAALDQRDAAASFALSTASVALVLVDGPAGPGAD